MTCHMFQYPKRLQGNEDAQVAIDRQNKLLAQVIQQAQTGNTEDTNLFNGGKNSIEQFRFTCEQ